MMKEIKKGRVIDLEKDEEKDEQTKKRMKSTIQKKLNQEKEK